MDPFEEFVAQFTNEHIEHQLEGNTYFEPGETPEGYKPVYMTTRLGEQQGKKFKPSVALLEKLSTMTTRKAIVNEKTAWLFLCGRNVLKEGILEKTVEEGLVLVMNKRGENLGYGKITGAGITNLLDRGDFLRRER